MLTDKRIEIAITVDMFAASFPTQGAYTYIHIDSVISVTAFGKLGSFSIVMFYNMGLQDVSCFRGDSGKYFDNIQT